MSFAIIAIQIFRVKAAIPPGWHAGGQATLPTAAQYTILFISGLNFVGVRGRGSGGYAEEEGGEEDWEAHGWNGWVGLNRG